MSRLAVDFWGESRVPAQRSPPRPGCLLGQGREGHCRGVNVVSERERLFVMVMSRIEVFSARRESLVEVAGTSRLPDVKHTVSKIPRSRYTDNHDNTMIIVTLTTPVATVPSRQIRDVLHCKIPVLPNFTQRPSIGMQWAVEV